MAIPVAKSYLIWLFATPWTAARQASSSFTISQSLLKLVSSEFVMPSNHLISVIPFSSCPQSFPASKSFPMSRLFTSCGQSSGASASVSVLPVNTQDWFPLGLTGLIFLHSKGISRVFSSITVQKYQFFCTQPSDMKSQLIGKDPDAWKDWGQEEKGTTEDEMVGWHHRHNEHGFEWTLGVGDGQRDLVWCGSWGCKEWDMAEWLNWTEYINISIID